MSLHKSKDNWTKESSSYCQHMNDKESVEQLKKDKKLQERIKKVKVL